MEVLETGFSRVLSQSCCLLPLGTWPDYLIFLRLSYVSCKMEIISASQEGLKSPYHLTTSSLILDKGSNLLYINRITESKTQAHIQNKTEAPVPKKLLASFQT